MEEKKYHFITTETLRRFAVLQIRLIKRKNSKQNKTRFQRYIKKTILYNNHVKKKISCINKLIFTYNDIININDSMIKFATDEAPRLIYCIEKSGEREREKNCVEKHLLPLSVTFPFHLLCQS